MGSQRKTKQSELTGLVMFPALAALAYAGYLYCMVGRANTNEGLLVALGLPTLLLAGFTTNIVPPPPSLIFAMTAATGITYVFAVYLFGVIGCAELGMGIVERSSWVVVALSLLWIALGWSIMKALADVRRLGLMWQSHTRP
jgi:hypothetical protein